MATINNRAVFGQLFQDRFPGQAKKTQRMDPAVRAQSGVQLQQAVAQPRQQPGTPALSSLAQTMGASLAELQGKKQLQRTQTQAQQVQQTGQQGLATQQEQARQRVQTAQAGAQQSQIDAVSQLANISQQAKQEIYDSRKQFASDELGRKFSNDRQLADYAKLTARNEEQFRNYQQNLEIALDRKRQLLNTALTKITSQREFENTTIEQLRDQMSQGRIRGRELEVARTNLAKKLDQAKRLAELEVQMRRQIAEEQAKSRNRLAAAQAIGRIGGAVIGGVVGGYFTAGTGTAAGAALGASAGSAIGGGVATFAAGQQGGGQ